MSRIIVANRWRSPASDLDELRIRPEEYASTGEAAGPDFPLNGLRQSALETHRSCMTLVTLSVTGELRMTDDQHPEALSLILATAQTAHTLATFCQHRSAHLEGFLRPSFDIFRLCEAALTRLAASNADVASCQAACAAAARACEERISAD